MMIIGVDYHPSFQTIAFLMEETGECGEQELNHSDGGAEKFYRDLKQRGIRVRVGREATGYARWFERLLAELGFERWIGDPAEIKAKRVKKQKFDRNDARLLRRLLLENNFPQIWIASPENRDLRQLLWHETGKELSDVSVNGSVLFRIDLPDKLFVGSRVTSIGGATFALREMRMRGLRNENLDVWQFASDDTLVVYSVSARMAIYSIKLKGISPWPTRTPHDYTTVLHQGREQRRCSGGR